MGALDDKPSGPHFLGDLTPRKGLAGTMSPRFPNSPHFRLPPLKTSLHTLKHTLNQTGLGDRFRLRLLGVFVLLGVSGVTLWMVRDRQVLLGELVEAREVQLSWDAGRKTSSVCGDVEEWKGLVDDYRQQVLNLQLKLENQRAQLRDGPLTIRANPVHRDQGGDRYDEELQELRVKPSTCFDSDFYKNQHPNGHGWSHEEAWHDFFEDGYRAGRAFTFHC